MAKSVPDRSTDPKRQMDFNDPCKTCGMIHHDPNFNYKTHENEHYLGSVFGNAMFKGK
jgi:hypothetical protein